MHYCRFRYSLVTSSGVRPPIEAECRQYMVIELSGNSEAHDSARMEQFLESLFEDEIVMDGTIAQDSSQVSSIWSVREGITLALGKAGAV